MSDMISATLTRDTCGSGTRRKVPGAFVTSGMPPSIEVLQTFKADLWKDQRRLDMLTSSGGVEHLVKHFSSESDARHEYDVLKLLATGALVAKVPEPVSLVSNQITLPYIRG